MNESLLLYDLLLDGIEPKEELKQELEEEPEEIYYPIFRDDLNAKKLLIDTLRVLLVAVFIYFTFPIWLLYDYIVTPIHAMIIQIRYEHEHMPVYPARKLSRKEKITLLIQVIICFILAVIMVVLLYFMYG